MTDNLRSIIEQLKLKRNQTANISVTVGFDGFIDEITRIVKSRENMHIYSMFKTITEFSNHIRNAAGKSADMELIVEDVKFGGNAPIMAGALAVFGFKTTCIGAMGYPEVNGVFKKMPAQCSLLSICEPGYTYAFEFDDGKLMFDDLGPLENLTWDRMKEQIGIDNIRKTFKNSSLIAILNWSLAYNAGTIWEGIENEVLQHLNDGTNSKIRVFFDLADPSKRLKEDILSVLKLVSSYSKYCDVTLGLNENEARQVYKAINDNNHKTDKADNQHNDPGTGSRHDNEVSIEDIGMNIFQSMNIDTLLIHPFDSCIGVTKSRLYKKAGKVITSPKISTGGGDNFNAGYCMGQLLGFDIEDSMIIGMAASGSYVKNGCSPSIDELVSYIEGRYFKC